MRLIDADAFFEVNKDIIDNNIDTNRYEVTLRELINEAPTVEQPHGEWIPCKSTRTGQVTNIDYKCSKCSHHKDRPMPYCEICGSIMKRSEKK